MALLPVCSPSHLYVLRHGSKSVWKVVLGIMGMRKGEVKGLRQTACTFKILRVALSCVFCVKVDRKCQNRCASAAELLANSAPFAVTRHLV